MIRQNGDRDDNQTVVGEGLRHHTANIGLCGQSGTAVDLDRWRRDYPGNSWERKTESSDRLVLMLVVRGGEGEWRIEPRDSEANRRQLDMRSVILIPVKQRPRAMDHGDPIGSRPEIAAGECARGQRPLRGTSGLAGHRIKLALSVAFANRPETGRHSSRSRRMGELRTSKTRRVADGDRYRGLGKAAGYQPLAS